MTICTQSRLENFRRRGGDSFIYQQNRTNTKCVFAASGIRYREENIERMTTETREDGICYCLRYWQVVREYANKLPFHGFVCGRRPRRELNGKLIINSCTYILHLVGMVYYTAGLVSPACWPWRKRSHAWWTKVSQLMSCKGVWLRQPQISFAED